jgi:hypothetical protein
MSNDQMNVAVNIIENHSRRLFDLSESFLDTGNERMSGRLKSVSDDLQYCADEIRDAFHKIICEYHDASVQNSFNVLQAALAGIDLGSKPK